MDNMSHTSAHKRRSPPPHVHRRAASPLPPATVSPATTPTTSVNGVASSSAYGRSVQSGLGKGYPSPASESPAPAFLSLDDPEMDGMTISSAPKPAQQSNGSGGGYAYSTTLRRQASSDHFQILGRSASPHASSSASALSPFRRRADSSADYQSDNPYAYNVSPRIAESTAELGMVDRAMRAGRRLVGATDGYTAIDLGEDAARAEGQRRMTETPSAIYAHKSVEETISAFSSHPTAGLSNPQLPSLLARYGPNEFQLPPSEPLAWKFAKQVYENPLILLLLGSSVVSALLGSYDDAICVVIAVAIVLTVAFVQEQRSEKSLEALNKLVPHYCNLVRNSQTLSPLANTLLPGDLITFSVGDRVPADVRLISAIGLEIDESALTGETRPSKKKVEECISGVGEDTHGEGGGKGLGERKCIGFMGTLVRSGHGSGIVVATGKDTEFGVIFSMMQDVEEKRTPLQIAMDDLAKRLSIFSFGVIGVIIIIGVWQKRGWLEMFTIGVSLAVAAIPEGLPIVTTVTLALGVLRMSKRKAIVKKLHSVEALGSVSVICSDKTGTLTTNEMTVTHLYAVDDLMDLTPHLNKDPFAPRHPDHPAFSPSSAMLKTATIGSVCNNAFRNESGLNVGQATEVALLNVLPLLQREDERKNFTRKSEYPFSSENKFMAVTGSMNGGADMVYMKGAPEAVLAKCRYYYVTDSSTPSLDPTTQKMILERTKEVAKRGLRVIAMAYGFPSAPNGRPAASDSGVEDPGNDLVFVGFEAMMDPPRKGVAGSISALHGAGVQVVMITGDAEATALAIARELGLKVNPSTTTSSQSPMSSCMLGTQIDKLSERELIERVPNITVFARTTPRHKMAIVKAWQMRGAVVAMTGDGVNDAPALKMADIGISMGKSGTDVAKEAADVILVDDDFSSILPAVEEGKSIFYNIQNFLSFQLSTAVAALSLITISTFLELANPLNAMQILFINILMDGPPAQALGVDPVDREIMKRPPRKKNEQILSSRLMLRIGFSAAMIVLGTLFVYVYEMGDGITRRDQTMTFTCFVFLDLVSALQNRGLTCPMFRNRMLSLTVGVSFLAQLALVYLPILQHVFQTEALSLRDLLTLLGLAGTSMIAHEGRRWWERKVGAEEVWVRGAGVV